MNFSKSEVPEEIWLECLVRVPSKYHSNLKAVCRSWNSLVNNPNFYHHRKAAGAAEQYVCLNHTLPTWEHSNETQQLVPINAVTVFDPLHGTWETLPFISQFNNRTPVFGECVSVNQKLVCIGGWQHATTSKALNSVFIYDFLSAKWRRGADMPTVRTFFACAVSAQGLVYVAGGHDENQKPLRNAEVYNVDEDKWEILPPMSQPRNECQGAFLDGKFYVISGYPTEFVRDPLESSAQIFDPNTGIWSMVANMWTLGESPRPCVSAFGDLYFIKKSTQEVMKYDAKKIVWNRVGSLPDPNQYPSSATVWCDSLSVCVTDCLSATVWYDRLFVCRNALQAL